MDIQGLGSVRGREMGAPRVLDVCVVTSEFLGAAKSGGIATAVSSLLGQLTREGHRVTLLYTLVEGGVPVTSVPWEELVESLALQGVELHFIPHQGDFRSWRTKSYHVKEFLRSRHFDLVYFNDHHGSGYYAMAAKRAGLAPFTTQMHCVIAHGSIEWVFDTNDHYIRRAADLVMIGIERRSFEWSDAVISPSRYLIEQYREYGWAMPAEIFCQPHPLAAEAIEPKSSAPVAVDELVFFGRLDTRKGLWLLCEALERLGDELSGKTVTFLGQANVTSGPPSDELILARSANWPFRVKLITDAGRDAALSYLEKGGRLAVIPSLRDNSPCVIYECIERGIPFISTLGSGASEILHPDSLSAVMVEPEVAALSQKLSEVLSQGAPLARFGFDPAKNRADWAAWHRYVGGAPKEAKPTLGAKAGGAALPAADAAELALFVTIDDGQAPLSLVLQTAMAHFREFGDYVSHLFITPRRSPLQNLLNDVLSSTGATVRFLGTDAVEDARGLIRGASTAVFCDSNTEVQPDFLATALRILDSGCTVVTCVTAERRNRTSEPIIHDLPCGDLPGIAALGHPVGSGLWACSVERLDNLLADLALVDHQSDRPVSASILGHRVLSECRVRGLPIQMVPTVGGIATRISDRPREWNFPYPEAVRAARLLSVEPSVFSGRAPWLAISGLSARQEPSSELDVENVALLSERHPLRSQPVADSGLPAARFAAALDRPELALQLGAASGAAPEEVQQLMDLAADAIRQRPSIDLRAALQNQGGRRLWDTQIPQQGAVSDMRIDEDSAARSNGGAEQAELTDEIAPKPEDAQAVLIYFDSKTSVYENSEFRVHGGRRGSNGSSGGQDRGRQEQKARLVVFDVPLAGHACAEARLRASERSAPAPVRIYLLDQQTGDEIGRATKTLEPGQPTVLAIPSLGVYGSAALVLEFWEHPNLRFKLEALNIA